MKQLCTLLCLLLLGGACSDDDTPNPAVKFSSPDSDVKISQDGTSAAITATHHAGQFVLTMEKNFEAVPESDRSWCTAVLSGDRLTVEIEENAEELRNAAISIMNGESVIGKITVEQGVAPTLSLGSSTAEFTNEGGGIDPITVTTNQERWDAACDAGWITISKEGDKLRLTASPNPDGGNRPAVVTVTTGCKDNPAEVSAAINVTQGPPSLILEYTVPAGGKIILPLSGAIDCTVDYGDGYSEKLALNLNPATGSLINYEYAEAGVYEVSVSGSVEQLYSLQGHSETSRSYLTAVKQWGNVNLTSMYYAFYLCSNLKTLPENTTDSFAEVTTFKYAFEGCSGLQTIPASLFSGCDKVTDVLGCFTKCASLTSVPENLLAPLKNVTSLQSFLAQHRQRLLVHRAAQLHDIDILRLVEQHTQPQEGRNDVQVMPLARLDLLGKGIDRRAGSDDDRIVILQQFEGALGDKPLGVAVDVVLDMHVHIGHMGVGGTGAAVHFVKQPFAFQYLDILADRHLRNPQFVGDVGNTHEPVFVQVIEDVFVSFGNTQHITLSFSS